jgi:DNA-binding MarR family transcriptional regulator/GNAT superfamily N-acetyltransferase
MASDDLIARVRDFNRYYTKAIGVLGGVQRTSYSLTEARILYELGRRDEMDVVELRRTLGMDAGHLSRILARHEADGRVVRERSATDGRRQVVRLTGAGRAIFEQLDARTNKDMRALFDPLTEAEQHRVLGAMTAIRQLLDRGEHGPAYVLRPPYPGDLGWMVQRQGAVYAQEYGWDDRFEALVARIVADYVEHRDPRREAMWIAEVDGAPVGSIMCVRKDDETAQLRLLFVDPAVRGMGIGARLVDECIRYATQIGYREMVLWTNSTLESARRIYQRTGFELVEEEHKYEFGQDQVFQTWRRPLR